MDTVLLAIPEVAKVPRLAERTVYDMCPGSKTPGVAKIGGPWWIQRKLLLAWLAEGGEAKKRGNEQRNW